MTVRLYPLSPTKAGVWLDCRRRWFMQYVQPAPVRARWAHLSLGTSIHAVLRDWFDVPPADRDRAVVHDLTNATWVDEGYRDAEQSRRMRVRAEEMAWSYVRALDPAFAPHSCERSLGARTDAVTVTGRIDRLDPVPGDDRALTVVDYKTGRQPPTADDARSSIALAAYVHCVRQSLRRPCNRVELHHIPSGEHVAWEHTDEGLARHLERLDRIGREMAEAERAWQAGGGGIDELFPEAPGPGCGWCDVRSQCPAGQRAAAAKDPWAGLPQ